MPEAQPHKDLGERDRLERYGDPHAGIIAEALAQPGQEQRMVTDAMIEAGCEAMHKVHAAMRDRNLADEPESMDDFDEGDVCRAVYAAMHAARPTADLGEDGELVERVVAVLEARRNIHAVREEQEAERSEERFTYSREDLFRHGREAMEFAIHEVRAVLSRRCNTLHTQTSGGQQ